MLPPQHHINPMRDNQVCAVDVKSWPVIRYCDEHWGTGRGIAKSFVRDWTPRQPIPPHETAPVTATKRSLTRPFAPIALFRSNATIALARSANGRGYDVGRLRENRQPL